MPRSQRIEPALLGLVLTAVMGVCVAGSHAAVRGVPGGAQAPTRLVVGLRAGVSADAVASLPATGLRTERSIVPIGVQVLSGSPLRIERALVALRAHPAVENVAADTVLAGLEAGPSDRLWPGQWGLRLTGFAQAWAVTRGIPRVRIAVLDTGVDRSHADLGGVLAGHDFVGDDSSPADDNGHGTAVAGILAAVGANGEGVAGACWECSVLPVKVLGADGSGFSSDVAAGIVWAVDHGARVINLSLGGPNQMLALSRAIAYATRHDVVVVAAAGNEGISRHSYPAADDDVLAVAASDPEDRLYGWSNRGDWVDLAAPGCNLTLRRAGGYGVFCGTSSATPLVTGLAGLIRSAFPQATAVETARLLRKAVVRVGAPVRAGRLDAALAFPVRRHSPPASSRGTPARSARQQPLPRCSSVALRVAIRRFSRRKIPSRKTLRPGFAALPVGGPASLTRSAPRRRRAGSECPHRLKGVVR